MKEKIIDLILRTVYTMVECALGLLLAQGSNIDISVIIHTCLLAGIITALRVILNLLAKYGGTENGDQQ